MIDPHRFHVYPIATIDEGIQLMTGIDAGEYRQSCDSGTAQGFGRKGLVLLKGIGTP